MERWQRTTGTVGVWPCGTHPHPNLTHNVQYSAFISLPVACTLPTDSLHSVSHLWAPRQWRVLRWGHSLPQLVRFVLSGWKEPQEQGSWYYSPPESCCSQGGLLRLTDLELNRLWASRVSCLILFYAGRWERWRECFLFCCLSGYSVCANASRVDYCEMTRETLKDSVRSQSRQIMTYWITR